MNLLQKSVYGLQMLSRRVRKEVYMRMPGLPDPIDENEAKEIPIDYWRFSMEQHKRVWRNSWEMYKCTWLDPERFDELYVKHTKDLSKAHLMDEEFQEAIQKLTAKQQLVAQEEDKNLGKENYDFLKQQLKDTQAGDNVELIEKQVLENIQTLKTQAQQHQLQQRLRQAAKDTLSQDDFTTTVHNNIQEMISIAEAGKTRASKLTQKDIQVVKTHAEEWLADKLVVGKLILVEFVKGYKEGKKKELQSETKFLDTILEATTDRPKQDENPSKNGPTGVNIKTEKPTVDDKESNGT